MASTPSPHLYPLSLMWIVANIMIVIAVIKIKMSANMKVKANFSILLTRHRGAVTANTNIPEKKD